MEIPLERQFSQIAIALLLEQPFFGRLLCDIVKRADGGTSSLEIRYEDPVFVLGVNPDFWLNQLKNRQERMGITQHQLLHLFFGHLWRAGEFEDPFLFDAAADMQVNAYIPEEWLWEDALRPDFPFEPDQSLAHYYRQLEEIWTTQGEGFSQLMDWRARRESLFGPHQIWRQTDERNARYASRFLKKQAGASVGEKALAQLPAALRLELDAGMQPPAPALNWRKMLRQFAQSSRRTVLKDTMRRPSKRYGASPGVRVRRRQRLLVAIDTSGSVSRAEQAAFFEEIRFLGRTGADITLLEFDADIQRVYPYRGERPAFVLGGGGTNFLPVLEHLNEKGPWDGAVIFTDGFAPIPRMSLRAPALWVVTQNGLSPDTHMYRALPGRKVKLIINVEGRV